MDFYIKKGLKVNLVPFITIFNNLYVVVRFNANILYLVAFDMKKLKNDRIYDCEYDISLDIIKNEDCNDSLKQIFNVDFFRDQLSIFNSLVLK